MNLEYALAQSEEGPQITITAEQPFVTGLEDAGTEKPWHSDDIERTMQALDRAHARGHIEFPLCDEPQGSVVSISTEALGYEVHKGHNSSWEALDDVNMAIGGISFYCGLRTVSPDNPLVLRQYSQRYDQQLPIGFALEADIVPIKTSSRQLEHRAKRAMLAIASQLDVQAKAGINELNQISVLTSDKKDWLSMHIGTHVRLVTDRGADEDERPVEPGAVRLEGSNVSHPAQPIILLAGLIAVTHAGPSVD